MGDEQMPDLATDRIGMLSAILIAVVTTITAVMVWRASMLSSEATGAERAGLINTLKAEAARSENLAYLYQQEADLAQSHILLQAQINYLRSQANTFGAMEDGATSAAVLDAEATALVLADEGTRAATPLIYNSQYRLEDGTFDLEARLEALTAEHPDLAALDPTADFERADRMNDQSLYLGLTVIVFAVALFALTLAEITKRPIRRVYLAIGVLIALAASISAVGLELYFNQLV